MKIIEQKSDTQFLVDISLPEKRSHNTCGVCASYFTWFGQTYLSTETGVYIKNLQGLTTNIISVDTSVQIPIHLMGEIILPYLNESPYLKPENYSQCADFNRRDTRIWPHDNKNDYMMAIKKPSGGYETVSYELYRTLKGIPYDGR